jgi:four helix bundle protein
LTKKYGGFRDLIVYKLSYQLAVEIFELTQSFPKEEKYSLTDQVRRSSRAIPALIAEAWSRRRYLKSFRLRLIDSEGEGSETTVWLDFALDHSYITKNQHEHFIKKYDEVCKMLNSMIDHPEKFCH